MKKFYLAIIFTTIIISSLAQIPGYLKLYHIKTPHYDVIFPQGIEKKAQEVANFLEQTYNVNTATLHTSPKRLKVILNNQSTISNGYTALGPRYTQWYLMPYTKTGLGISEWTQLLSVHEIRHNIQYQTLDRNFNKIMHILGGQYGLAGAINWSVPMWFYEGDAVFQETILTKSGRGRLGHFAMPVKTIVMEYPQKQLNYYKFFYRSYKTFYPNHYYLGYYLVTYINRKYGPEQWYKILNYSTHIAFLPNAMNVALKKQTGLNYKQLFDSTMLELKNIWNQQQTYNNNNFFVPPHSFKRSFTNYYRPRFINDSTIIFIKSGFDNINSIYTLNIYTGEETYISPIPTTNFSYRNNKIVWSEQNPNIRWSESSYSNIVVKDLYRNKRIYLSKKGRYFSPEFSSDGQKIVAIEYTKDLIPKLVIFDLNSLKKAKEYPFPQFNFIRFPRFSNDDKNIVFTATDNKGNGLYMLNIQTNKLDTVINSTYNLTISYPIIWENHIIFTSDLNGSENIFAIDYKTKETYQISNVPYSAIISDINTNSKLAFSNYTKDGYDIAILNLIKKKWHKVDISKSNQENYFFSDKTINYIKDYTENFRIQNNYDIKPYNRIAHLINFHSWIPNISLNNDSSINSNVTIYSKDVLQELNLNYSAEYINTGQITNSISFNYRHFFPVIEFNFRHIRNWTNDITLLKSYLNFSLPLNLSKYVWYRNLTIRQTNSITYNPEIPAKIISTGGNIRFYNIFQPSYRDIESRFSQIMYLDFEHNIQGYENQIISIANFNFPGVLHHDVMKLNFSFQKITGNIYPRQISLPAGYKNITYHQINKLRLAYYVPLMYPDWGWYKVFNIKRLRTKIFYDLAFLDNNRKYSSLGLQILADFNLFGFNLDIGAGIQFAYTLEEKSLHLAPIIDNLPLN